ncbi:hypothetical protein Tco_0810891 [Tanacetum coccineum]
MSGSKMVSTPRWRKGNEESIEYVRIKKVRILKTIVRNIGDPQRGSSSKLLGYDLKNTRKEIRIVSLISKSRR